MGSLRSLYDPGLVPFYRERFRMLERLAARGVRSVRDVTLTERSRFARLLPVR